jgi:UDPglucose 6-dehydrogenase
MGFDKRIARDFLNAGAGFGGNCFPKDLDAFIYLAEIKGYNFELLKAVRKINHDQKKLIMKKIEDALWIIKGKTIAVLGLSFKPMTDDIRNSIAIDMIKLLQDAKAIIRAYDPQALRKAKGALKNVTLCKNAYDACRGADCCLVMTEWDDFKDMDMAKVKKMLRQPVVIDTRNIYDPQAMVDMGFIYKCIGRGSANA